MCFLPAQFRCKRHHDGLRVDKLTRNSEVFLHAPGVDLQAGDEFLYPFQGANRVRCCIRDDRPFHLPCRRPALVVLYHRFEHARNLRAHQSRRDDDLLRQDGIAFLRHRGANPTSTGRRFVNLADFGLRKHHDIRCDFRQAAGQEPEESDEFT